MIMRILLLTFLLGYFATATAQTDVASFDETPPPPAPDYSHPASWAATGALPGPAAATPAGASDTFDEPLADVFYIHPTTYRTQEHWNQDIADAETNAWTDASVVARQASVFNDCCRVFAPRYRQASFLATKDRLMQSDGGKAYALAYDDVERAFDYYLEHFNEGRPFIIAGHSQGGLHTYKLLKERLNGNPAAGRMVAAYAIGLDLSIGEFERSLSDFDPCETASQTGCVLSWNAVTEETDLDMLGQFAGGRYALSYKTDEGRLPLCINPLTFEASQPSATAASSQGAVPGPPAEGPVLALETGRVAATCDRGFLVTEPDPLLQLAALPGGSLHYHDYGLFYENIRTNAAERVHAFLKR
jgi:Protein of unknown function (DUF3089)